MTARRASTTLGGPQITLLVAAIVATIASSLTIQLGNHLLTRASVGISVTVALLVLGIIGHRRSSPIARAVLGLAALSTFGWVSTLITSRDIVVEWLTGVPPAAAFLAVNATKLASVAVLLLIARICGWSRQSMLLVPGQVNARTGIPGLRWTVAGPVAAVVVAVLFLSDPAVTSRGLEASQIADSLLPVLPLLLAGPLVNATAEELLYRHALIPALSPAIGSAAAIVISSVIFGLGHVTGSPGGVTGVLFTLAYGLLSAMAMVQTRGATWNMSMHVVADFAAITAITLSQSG